MFFDKYTGEKTAGDLDSKLVDSLRENSRTFYIPVMKLEGDLRAAVAASYLGFRAIDEIEDHPELPADTKQGLLLNLASYLTESVETRADKIERLLSDYQTRIPQVSLDLNLWIDALPSMVAPRALSEISTMAARMAYWVGRDWRIDTESDLDQYTFAVAGAVGLLLTDLFAWYTGANADYRLAVQFGQGLQAVNILLNRADDLKQGRDFFPDGWGNDELHKYALARLQGGRDYFDLMSNKMIKDAFTIPLDLAFASLEVFMKLGRKLTREEVVEICRDLYI
ncbi:MAG: squalene/phytoene synthase family protein [Candidatus Zixiibacteriota bacterium]